MTEVRPLREVFADSAGQHNADPAELLAAHGHPDLPEELVAEAVVSYADTAPAEVAEHLAPFVIQHGPMPTGEPSDTPWFDLLSTAPEPAPSGLDSPQETLGLADDPGLDLDFGAGATLDTEVDVEIADLSQTPIAEHQPAAPDDFGWEPASQDPAGAGHPVDLPDSDGDLFD
jgi:hypothetical protein